MPDDNGISEVTAEVGPGGLKLGGKSKQMAELIAIASACGTILVGYMLYAHAQDSKDRDTQIATAITKLADSQSKQAEAFREMTCLISLPQDKREAEFSSPFGMCKRIAR